MLHRSLTALFAIAALSLTAAAAQSSAWPQDFEPVLASFWAGRYDDVRLFCQEQVRAADPQRRREANLLLTLVALRDGSRSERSEALGRIEALASESPDAARRPEVLLAEPGALEVAKSLKSRGHAVFNRSGIAATQAVSRSADGLQGGSDPRKGGRPAGY